MQTDHQAASSEIDKHPGEKIRHSEFVQLRDSKEISAEQFTPLLSTKTVLLCLSRKSIEEPSSIRKRYFPQQYLGLEFSSYNKATINFVTPTNEDGT